MNKTWLKKSGLYASALLMGVSSYALLRHVAKKNAPEFTQTQVVVGTDTISIQQFYENLSRTAQGWVYHAPDGSKHSVDSLCDYRHKEAQISQALTSIKLKNKIDTVFASYGDEAFEQKHGKKIMYKYGNLDSLPNMPSMGRYDYDHITIREFWADNTELQQKMDKYNDTQNCTYRHEFQHFLNAQNGLRNWNDYSLKFVEVCADEISGNIAQCKAQRTNYINSGKDINAITDRFKGYKSAIENGEITPQPIVLSEKEQEIIANTVFDDWMKNKYEDYAQAIFSRTRYYLKDAPYQATSPDMAKHKEVMKKMFTIDGYDFWKYIAKRETEIFARITPDMEKEWTTLKNIKKNQMTHFDKLEQQKQTSGEKSYNKTLRTNHLKSKIIELFSNFQR